MANINPFRTEKNLLKFLSDLHFLVSFEATRMISIFSYCEFTNVRSLIFNISSRLQVQLQLILNIIIKVIETAASKNVFA